MTIPENLINLQKSNPNCEYLQKLIENYEIFIDIYKICGNKFWKGCGSYLFDGQTYSYYDKMYEKQKLLYEAAKKATNVLEIGVYMGHSIFIMLLANPKLNITCIDIDDTYSFPATTLMKLKFNANINFIKGDSKHILPSIGDKFDMFHIDGHHDAEYLNLEFHQCVKFANSENFTVIIDDYDAYPNKISEILENFQDYKISKKIIPNCNWRNIVLEFS
jgi:hypothetical protein